MNQKKPGALPSTAVLFHTMALAAALLLTGCVNPVPPPMLYKLSATATGTSDAPGPSLGIRSVKVPEYVRRSAIIRELSDGSLRAEGDERWAEPLEDGIRRVLALNLSAQLPTDDVRSYPWSSSYVPEVILSLEFIELAVTPEGVGATVQVKLTVSREPSVGQLVSLKTPLNADASGADIARAMSQLMAQLSSTLVEAITAQTDEG